MADYIVKHLSAVYVLEYHVVMVLMHNHIAHTAYVRVVEQLRKRSLTDRADLFRGILGCLLGGGFGVW
jgi:hypothetical protein